MQIRLSRFNLVKRHALTISRGTSAGSENLLVEVEEEGIIGLGEMAPTSGGAVAETADLASAELEARLPLLSRYAPWEREWIYAEAQPPYDGCAWYAALDMALHDWLGKRAGLPLWKLFGLNLDTIPPTSLTVGINPPDVVCEVVAEILGRTSAQALKVKLGSPDGIEADKAILAAAQESAGDRPLLWRVDANGGWDVEEARTMLRWLAERNVGFVEQPLLRGQEADLPAIHKDSPLPIFADESIHVATDIPPLAPHIDGVNLKLMKCGGLREALRIIHTAQAHGLKVMMGCMSESSLAITATAHLSPLADALDLDSHLNLLPDPFEGAEYVGGRVVPNDRPGLGVRRVA